jgi:magnesium chelatase subunit I
LTPLGVKGSEIPQRVAAAAEFLLEGLVAHKKLSRSEERGFTATDKPSRRQERPENEREYEDWQQAKRTRRGGLN